VEEEAVVQQHTTTTTTTTITTCSSNSGSNSSISTERFEDIGNDITGKKDLEARMKVVVLYDER